MNDTSPEIDERFIDMMMKKSGQERMEMGFSMFEMAREQVIASIKRDKPHASLTDIKRELFPRFYGQKFTVEEQAKILNILLK